MTVIQLPSARTRTAEANLAAFLAKARSVGAFGPIKFDDAVWEANLIKRRRPTSSAASANKMYFTDAQLGKRGLVGRTPLREPFTSFLKAVVRLREDDAPRHMDDHAGMIRAGRYLHDKMDDIGHNPCLLLTDHFDRAARVSLKVDSQSTAYTTGNKLEQIADFINKYNLARVRIDFHSPAPYPKDSHPRLGPEADARRDKKMPSEAALDALAKLSNQVTDDSDILMIRIIELLACGGWRINELLNIPAVCEVEEQAVENGSPVLDANGSVVTRYGIRYHGEKGAPPLPKWLPSPMVDVGRRAIADIRRITQPTRDAAAWMAEHQGLVNVPGFVDEDLDVEIGPRDLETALGISDRSGGQWCTNRNVPYRVVSRQMRIRKRDIVDALLADVPVLPPGSPYPLHHYMFIAPSHMNHRGRLNARGSIGFVTDGSVARFIGGSPSCASVFERFGMLDAAGAPIRMNSHQFRHWLNTLAQEGGMSQHEIARWSGRKSVNQNAAYDHVSAVQLAKDVRALITAGDVRGPIAAAYEGRDPVDRAAFLEAQVGTAHVTDIGLCIHDWSMLPCLKHGACAGCPEHVVVKGDERQREQAVRMLDETRVLLSKAEEEAVEGTYGAPRWIEAHRRAVGHLDAVVAVHADQGIPDGTLVHAAGSPGIARGR